MSTAAAIPIASFGNNPEVAQAIREKLLPGYDVVHTTLTLSTSLSELPPLCTGTFSHLPSSNLGSNATAATPADLKVPKAIIFGGGVSPSDAEQVKEAVLAKNPDIKFVQLTREDMVAAGAEGPDPEVIGRLLKERLAEALA
ncbi:uncharacterized protein B0T23DRAFT_231797 [Neurospora hispaniola]|uniref:Uncharacterized protein n=1 Tax=Neurospora hispaniola TaxID=588809 RepID=A0AAJ0MMT9_9PEZI|nr:hypothetical protein B0T23DRAFT_231797 [Neurospora hispaniola]